MRRRGRHQHTRRPLGVVLGVALVTALGSFSAMASSTSPATNLSLPGSVAVGETVIAQRAAITAQRVAEAAAAEQARQALHAAIMSVPEPTFTAGQERLAALDLGWQTHPDAFDMAMRLTAGEFPELPADSGEGKRVVYSNSLQRVWLIAEDGFVLDSYLVSGRKGDPRPGTYQVYSKSKLAYSHHGITMRYMVRFAWGKVLSIGFHEIPKYAGGRPMQTEDQLGTFQSAGCVRQQTEDARRLYHWADIGTTVVVTP